MSNILLKMIDSLKTYPNGKEKMSQEMFLFFVGTYLYLLFLLIFFIDLLMVDSGLADKYGFNFSIMLGVDFIYKSDLFLVIFFASLLLGVFVACLGAYFVGKVQKRFDSNKCSQIEIGLVVVMLSWCCVANTLAHYYFKFVNKLSDKIFGEDTIEKN